MKKFIPAAVLCCLITAGLTTDVFGGFASDFKRAACERSCDEVYNKCMKAAGEVVDREGQGDFEGGIKDDAKVAACGERRDKCMEKCD